MPRTNEVSEGAVTTRNYIAEFREAFNAGIDGIVKAAAVYVDAVDENPRNADKFTEAFDGVVPSLAWSQFEAIGRKWMHPRLLMGGGGRYAAKIKRLPYSVQERIFAGERFDLVCQGGDTLKVDIRETTPEQVDQIIDGTHLRTPSEQRAYLESRSAIRSPLQAEPMPYTVQDGKVTFRRGTVLTKADLKRLLMEM